MENIAYQTPEKMEMGGILYPFSTENVLLGVWLTLFSPKNVMYIPLSGANKIPRH